MTKERAIEQLKHSISGWEEFWSGACHYISEEDIEAIECLIKVAEEK